MHWSCPGRLYLLLRDKNWNLRISEPINKAWLTTSETILSVSFLENLTRFLFTQKDQGSRSYFWKVTKSPESLLSMSWEIERNFPATFAIFKNVKPCDQELYRGRILGCNWDKSLKSFPPCYSQSHLLAGSPEQKWVWNWLLMKTQV
jgi:hypothetical protein